MEYSFTHDDARRSALIRLVMALEADGALVCQRIPPGKAQVVDWWSPATNEVNGAQWAAAVLNRANTRLGMVTDWLEVSEPWGIGPGPSAVGEYLVTPLRVPAGQGHLILVNPRSNRDAAAVMAELAAGVYSNEGELERFRSAWDRREHLVTELRNLIQTARLITAERSLDTVLRSIVAQARRLTNCDIAHLLLADETKTHMVVHLSDGLERADYRALRLPMDQGIIGQVNQSGRSVNSIRLLDDQRRNPEFDNLLEQEGIVSGLCSPMFFRGEMIGMLYLLTREKRAFNQEEIAQIDDLSSVAAIALENARLFEQQAQALQQISHLHEVTERQASTLQLALETHQKLVGLVLAEKGIDAITATLAELLDAPAVIESVGMQVMALGLPAGQQRDRDEVSLKELMDAQRVRPFLAELRESRRSVQIPPVRGRGWRLVVPLAAGAEFVGYVSILGGAERFHDHQVAMAEQGALVIALEMVKANAVSAVEERLGSDLVVRLLTRGADQDSSLVQRARYLGYDLAGDHLVMALRLEQAAEAETDPLAQEATYHRATRQVLAAHHVEAIMGAYQGDLLILMRPPPYVKRGGHHDFARSLFAALQKALPDTVCFGGISEALGLPWLPEAYRQATLALEITIRLDLAGQLQPFEQLGVLRLLARIEQSRDVGEFVRSTVGHLLDYDEEQGTQLLLTLYHYVLCNGNARATADSLQVHTNTLKYRLRRIEEIAGVRLNDPEAILNLHVALKILRLQGIGGLGEPQTDSGEVSSIMA